MRKKVLIVEHELAVGDALERRVRARGYQPMRTADADSALRRFDEARPDLVVISLTLPADGGRAVCRGIRMRPLGALVPILFLGTGREEVRNVTEAIAAGADHFFRKPEGIEDLLGKVVTYIGPGESPVPLPDTPPPNPAALVAALAEPLPTSIPPATLTPGEEGVIRSIRDVLAGGPSPPPVSAWEDVTRPEVAVPTPRPSPGAAPRVTPAETDWAALDSLLQGRAPPPEPDVPPPPSPVTRRAAAVLTGSPLGPALTPPDDPAASPPREPFAPARAPAPPGPPPMAPGPGTGWQPPPPPPNEAAARLAELLAPGRAVELERRGLGELLAAATEVGLTGRIEVAAGGVLRRVFFEGGQPVYADGSDANEDLAAYLAGEGQIARGALAEARTRSASTGAAPEEILIEAGYLRPEQVYRALRGYVVERVLALFGLESGEALVIQGGPRPLDPVDLGLPAARLLLDGVRRRYGRLRLYRAFGTPSAVARPRPDRPLPAGLVLRPDEQAVRMAVDGQRTAADVARVAGLGEVDALAILYGLVVLGILEPPSGRAPGLLPSLDAASLARAGAPRTDDEMPGFAELVAVKFAEATTSDYFQVLGVPRTATGAEVRAAWERLRRQFDPHRVRREGPLWHQVREIAAVVEDAYAILSDERLRAAYQANLE